MRVVHDVLRCKSVVTEVTLSERPRFVVHVVWSVSSSRVMVRDDAFMLMVPRFSERIHVHGTHPHLDR